MNANHKPVDSCWTPSPNNMTVGVLIAKLQQLPPDLIVAIYEPAYDACAAIWGHVMDTDKAHRDDCHKLYDTHGHELPTQRYVQLG